MIFSFERLDLERDGADWPNRAASRMVKADGLSWHVQRFGAEGPRVLLIHGTGAATHSWRDVAPLLGERARVLAADLPGHGFSGAPPSYRFTLPGMAAAHGALLGALDFAPEVIVGHSAGAAIAIRMALDGRASPRAILSFNGALRPFTGSAGAVFPWMARALFLNPATPRLFAWSADARRVRKLLESTGSAINHETIALYGRLFRNPGHVAGALGMMAHWDLAPLLRDLPWLDSRLALLVGLKDRTVSPDVSRMAAARAPRAELIEWADAGHLAHEELPEQAARLILSLSTTAESAG